MIQIGTEIENWDATVGKIAVFKTHFCNDIIGASGVVTRVSGSRIYYNSSFDANERYKSQDNVCFVCDNQEEVNQLRALNNACIKNMDELELQKTNAYRHYYQRMKELARKRQV